MQCDNCVLNNVRFSSTIHGEMVNVCSGNCLKELFAKWLPSKFESTGHMVAILTQARAIYRPNWTVHISS